MGASCAASGAIEPFSGRGPTTDGRVKPDLVGPDGTSSSIYGPANGCLSGFLGTSAATPHVAGAAALVLDAQPGLGPTDVQGILEQRATPAGAAGKDSTWGWGRLALGAANAPTAPTGSLFTGLSPSARLLDTRTANNPLGGGSTRPIQIAGTNGVPADATAVVLSVVAIKPTAAGYLTAFPAGAARPVASSLNFAKGQVISNSVTVGLGPSGGIGLFNYAGTTNVVVDIAGWYGPTATTGLQTVDPIRAVDTRPGKSTRITVPGGDIGGTEVLTARLAGNPAIPEVPASAVAVVLNAAVTAPTITGHLTVWPDGVAKPLASNLNFDKGATVANLVVAKTGTNGQVKVATNGGKTHVILDIVGYYDAAAPGRFVALPTVNRVYDTRTGTGSARRPAIPNQIAQRRAHGAVRHPRRRHGRRPQRDGHQPRVRRPPQGLGSGSTADGLHLELHDRRDHRKRRARRRRTERRARRRVVRHLRGLARTHRPRRGRLGLLRRRTLTLRARRRTTTPARWSWCRAARRCPRPPGRPRRRSGAGRHRPR